ncbi:MAG: glyoxalase [Fimbriimonas sp.]
MILGLDHVAITIPAGSEDEARGFYGGVLGLREIPKPPVLALRGGVWYEMPDGRQLHLQAANPFTPQNQAHPAFVADLEALAAVSTPEWDDHLKPRRRFYLRDPFGNRLEFLEQP